jgi:hypothetical protein
VALIGRFASSPARAAVRRGGGVVTLVLTRHRSTRVWAVALVLPMCWLAQELLDPVLYGTGFIR